MKIILNSAMLLLSGKNKEISPLFVSNKGNYKPTKDYQEYIKKYGNINNVDKCMGQPTKKIEPNTLNKQITI
jgi:hypothetical protein